MKIVRYVVLAILALGFSGVANANNFRVLDPTGDQGSFPAINITGSNPFTFYTCEVIPAAAGCFGAVNNSSFTITSISFTITADVPLGDTDCPTDSFGGLSSAFTNAPVCTVSGDSITVLFSGGDGVAKGSTIWIVEDDLDPGDFGPDAGSFTVTTNATPEPSTLWMALTSLGPLGYVVRRRRKVSH